MDRLTEPQRSALMARVRSKHTAPERQVRRAAHSLGLRFRLHRRDLPGKPDLVFPRHRLALFVHGCFWHCHPGCPRASEPATRKDFWKAKLEANRRRDAEAVIVLEGLGWRTLIVWECEAKRPSLLRQILIDAFDLRSSDVDDINPR
jgi:DNA mismatch endonuclease (patch repair protein)